MRVLVSLMGPGGGQLVDDERGSTRAALARIPHDAVHVLATEPDSDELDTVRSIVERSGGRFSVEPIDADGLLDAFETIVDAIDGRRAAEEEPRDEDVEVHVQVNAGRHANLLSTAGLLACLHTGAEAHFVHERGHTRLPVLTRSPLDQLLSADERDALSSFPDQGVPLQAASEHDAAALNGLKDRGLIEREGTQLVLTAPGRSYRQHVSRRRG